MARMDVRKYKDIIWYSLCVLFLGVIDQRRGSAPGHIQIIFANLVGVTVCLFLIPSMKKEFWHRKGTRIQGLLSAIVLPIFIFVIKPYVNDWGLWSTGAANAVGIGFLIRYILWERKNIFREWKLKKVAYGLLMVALLLMLLSVNKTVWPGLYLVLFGCFYLIGIPKTRQEHCMIGILCGLAIWFVAQQCLAFGFRPYDYIRYRGLYKGETQNGLFYMIAFCAFMGIGLYASYKKCKKIWCVLSYIMSAGCVSLLLLTGGKSSLAGVVAGAAIGYFLYDCFIRGRFKYWAVQCIALGMCAIILFPVAYGLVRYLPTVLHHPIWFEGEYDEERCVHSFDPWNSERYISFERALEKSLGRILGVVGIHIEIEDGQLQLDTPLSIQTEAAEPGSSKDNPYLTEDSKASKGGTIDPARIAIWKFYIKNLNLEGHNGLIFYYRADRPFGNAHNMFLHVAVLYGIIPGVLFVIWNVWCLVRLVRRKDMVGIVSALIMSAIMTYGLFEQAITTGQITLSLLFILYYFGMEMREAEYQKTK